MAKKFTGKVPIKVGTKTYEICFNWGNATAFEEMTGKQLVGDTLNLDSVKNQKMYLIAGTGGALTEKILDANVIPLIETSHLILEAINYALWGPNGAPAFDNEEGETTQGK